MEPPPVFRFPNRDSQPLHPLSPERVNGTRPVSALSTTATKTSKASDTESNFPPTETLSAHSSPTRKANLFADYHPTTPSKTSNGFGLPQSPSLPEIHALRSHVRTNSDVQGLVKRFEHLDVRDKDAESADRRRKHEAELRRAQIAREEAESDVRRLREELRRMRKEGDESRERERKVARRLEVVMEEYASAKEQYSTQTSVYEKELRKARKEAFKSSSAVLKAHEELKSTRNSLRITQSGFEMEKQKVQRREQETFNAQYQLAAAQEELDKLKAHLATVEQEKEALKTNLKEEEVARIAAEGMIALPAANEDDDLFSSPKKQSPVKGVASPLSDDKENIAVVPKKAIESKKLQEQLAREQMRRQHAEEMLEFLSMECTFRCCKCQLATKQSQDHALAIPADIADSLDSLMESMKSVMAPPGSFEYADGMDVDGGSAVTTETLEAEYAIAVEAEAAARGVAFSGPNKTTEALEAEYAIAVTAEAAAREFAVPSHRESRVHEQDQSMTMTAEAQDEQTMAEEEAPVAPRPTPADPQAQTEADDTEPEMATTVPLQDSTPQTPSHAHQATPFRPQALVRTVTTTTTVPMHFTPISKPPNLHHVEDAENIPPQLDGSTATPTFDRAAALAAIEYRRGRAKSIASGHMTPRKQMLEGVNMKERRDISAPALGGKAVGLGFAKGASSVGRAAGRRMG